MRAGQMKDRVKFKTNVVTDDGSGGQISSWNEVVTVWGFFKPFRGKEAAEGDRLQATSTGQLQVRSSAVLRTVTEKDVVEIAGVDYQIRNIENMDRKNRTIDMFIERGVVK